MHEAHPGVRRSPSAASPQPSSARQAPRRQHRPPARPVPQTISETVSRGPRQRPGARRRRRRPGPRSSGTRCWTPTAPATSASSGPTAASTVVGGDLVVHQAEGGAFRSVSGPRRWRRSSCPTTRLGHGAGPPPRRPPRSCDLAQDARRRTTWLSSPCTAPPRSPGASTSPAATADGSPAGEYVFVGARNGRVLDRWASAEEATGSGTGVVDGTVSPRDHPVRRGSTRWSTGTRGGNATYNGPPGHGLDPDLHRRRQHLGQRHHLRPRHRAADAALRRRRDLGLLQERVRPQRHRQRRQGRARPCTTAELLNAFWSDSCFCMGFGDGDGAIPAGRHRRHRP